MREGGSQLEGIYRLLSDYRPHRTDEIVDVVYGPGSSLARVGARIYDIKKRYGVTIHCTKDQHNKKLHWYTMERKFVPVTLPPAYEKVEARPRTASLF